MNKIKFDKRIKIICNTEFAFGFTQDYTKGLTWDTFLIRAELMEGAAKADKGVKVNCVAKNGLSMVTEYVTFNRPKTTAIKMVKGPFLFKSFLGT